MKFAFWFNVIIVDPIKANLILRVAILKKIIRIITTQI